MATSVTRPPLQAPRGGGVPYLIDSDRTAPSPKWLTIAWYYLRTSTYFLKYLVWTMKPPIPELERSKMSVVRDRVFGKTRIIRAKRRAELACGIELLRHQQSHNRGSIDNLYLLISDIAKNNKWLRKASVAIDCHVRALFIANQIIQSQPHELIDRALFEGKFQYRNYVAWLKQIKTSANISAERVLPTETLSKPRDEQIAAMRHIIGTDLTLLHWAPEPSSAGNSRPIQALLREVLGDAFETSETSFDQAIQSAYLVLLPNRASNNPSVLFADAFQTRDYRALRSLVRDGALQRVWQSHVHCFEVLASCLDYLHWLWKQGSADQVVDDLSHQLGLDAVDLGQIIVDELRGQSYELPESLQSLLARMPAVEAFSREDGAAVRWLWGLQFMMLAWQIEGIDLRGKWKAVSQTFVRPQLRLEMKNGHVKPAPFVPQETTKPTPFEVFEQAQRWSKENETDTPCACARRRPLLMLPEVPERAGQLLEEPAAPFFYRSNIGCGSLMFLKPGTSRKDLAFLDLRGNGLYQMRNKAVGGFRGSRLEGWWDLETKRPSDGQLFLQMTK